MVIFQIKVSRTFTENEENDIYEIKFYMIHRYKSCYSYVTSMFCKFFFNVGTVFQKE